ncbi:hypothetical protein SNE40_019588 [Patella caerulea]|uniref:EF-hand domain-containing protein n=1 Tax=Patella caerulea TaxID=87958 RepID=A0AAN8P9V0_PATCE
MAKSVLPVLEKAIFTAFFHAADKNRDGYLSLTELDSVVAQLGLNLSMAEIQTTFTDMDTNKDWKISLEEFLNGMQYLDPNKRKAAMDIATK